MKRTKDPRCIVVADGKEFYRLMLGELLKRYGYDVKVAGSDKELMEVLGTRQKLDLMIFDLSMPDQPGLDYLDGLRKKAGLARLPIIVTTERYLDDSQIDRLKKSGIVSFVNKALPIEELLGHVNSVFYPKEQDLRKSPRAQVSIPLHYEQDGEGFSSHTFNLSRDGMFVVTLSSPPPKPNSRITLKFWLPTSDRIISCTGLVIWCNNIGSRINELYPPGMGVMFTDLDPKSTEVINRYVREKLKSIF